MPAKIIDGKAIAADLREKIAADVAEFHASTSVTPHLVAILVGDDQASAVYVRNKEADCAKVGIKSTLHRLPAETTQADLLELIQSLNHYPDVHGILCQLPLPAQIDEQTILDSIDPSKDVDAFHPENVGRIAQGRPRFLPCTPHGCQHLLIASGIETKGAHAVVLGRSEIVGKPLAMMLMQRGAGGDATVTICHSRTKGLSEITRQADILIAAIGKTKFVTADMVKPGAAVIDVGINRDESTGKLVGDVDYEALLDVASAITPVPGGVGPMTRAMLLRNTLTAAKLSR
ncbi:bifunctional methylenetetrahydrofolate dehydrogenase/methenyltetrahydrofolate cyclohydrolase FolD [Stratiformator vulcanicus]|uniref:Bifunctional protein FolD n=1 Tax=Stratiformator vulcanicus TaxID=2527980 RepID=A0A517R1K6_9PLAN|nr:bifunctional methylenetetrahydrofolate dehydrogenase/methenyltetrahydrofolate cyclohydrolase FolD [Stratiformator vulcanicus]QDT37740.1 Tetrahydrofolate dehydrogenase/cyclohydrolase [Stratiformator vulcanicus]